MGVRRRMVGDQPITPRTGNVGACAHLFTIADPAIAQ
jgi:hypothetical protein